MQRAQIEDLGFGISCLDAQYLREGLACFYLVERDGELAIIETGTVHSVPLLLEVLLEKGLSPEQVRYVIPTHVHLDHAGGAGLMMDRFPSAQLLVHPRGGRHLVDPERLVSASKLVYGEELFQQLYGEIVPAPADRVVEIEDGAEFSLGQGSLLLRYTPGHADHHFCIWDELSRGWFSGDIFGISYRWFRTPGGDYVMPATTPTQFRPVDYANSLELLASRQPERIFLTHYGELRFTPAVHTMLLEQIDAYLPLAHEHRGDASSLEPAILEYSLSVISELNPGIDMSYLREDITHDARLNAQGLAAWYERETR